jgi:hypothetical protein
MLYTARPLWSAITVLHCLITFSFRILSEKKDKIYSAFNYLLFYYGYERYSLCLKEEIIGAEENVWKHLRRWRMTEESCTRSFAYHTHGHILLWSSNEGDLNGRNIQQEWNWPYTTLVVKHEEIYWRNLGNKIRKDVKKENVRLWTGFVRTSARFLWTWWQFSDSQRGGGACTNLLPDTTSASITVVTTLRKSLNMYVFFALWHNARKPE